MANYIRIRLWISLFVFLHILYAQNDGFEYFEEEQTVLTEYLQMLEENPLDLNTLTREDLAIFPFLHDSEIDTILKYQPYSTLREIASRLPDDLFEALSPFITLNENPAALTGNFTSRIAFSPETMRGIQDHIYLGSKYNIYNRMRLSYGENLSSGLLSHKDTGELSVIDHYNGFIQWQNTRFHLIAGSFSLQYGEGLAFSRAWFSGRSSSTLAPLKPASLGGKAVLSSTEDSGFSGLYGSAPLTSLFTLNIFYSKSLVDAIPGETGQGVTALAVGGYHRTQNEIDRKDLAAKSTAGAALIFRWSDYLQFGFAHAWYAFSPDIIADEKEETSINVWYNRSRISSLFNTLLVRNLILSSEIALSTPGSFARQYGILFKENHWSAGGKYWYLPNTFCAPDGRAFLNSNRFPQGVKGFYFGISGRLIRHFNIDGYWQSEKQLWRGYFNTMPLEKKWYFLQVKWDPEPATEITMHYRYTGTTLRRHALRLTCKKRISHRFILKTGMEKVIETLNNKNGINLYQNIKVNLIKSVSLQGRYSSFNTIDYDARIYEYEADLPGAYAMSVVHGKGNKVYLMLCWKPHLPFSLFLKYRRLYFEGAESTGSGYAEIPGDTRRDIRCQLNISF